MRTAKIGPDLRLCFAKLSELTLHKEITKFMASVEINESSHGTGRDVISV